ncbi:hypothetical protein F4809DRAFT_644210 [Biscogniauxia mediterranea]|nr:hypothetical protein F4809DRAFT_644210 [Biscogniauxia mediterranea]
MVTRILILTAALGFRQISWADDAHLSYLLSPLRRPRYEEAFALTGNRRLDDGTVGLQSRVVPVVLKVKEVLASGRTSRVLSSESAGTATSGPGRDGLPERLSTFADRKIRGRGQVRSRSPFAYTIDYAHDVARASSRPSRGRMQVQHPRW